MVGIMKHQREDISAYLGVLPGFALGKHCACLRAIRFRNTIASARNDRCWAAAGGVASNDPRVGCAASSPVSERHVTFRTIRAWCRYAFGRVGRKLVS